MDVKCLLRTVLALIRQDGIVEGRRQVLWRRLGLLRVPNDEDTDNGKEQLYW